MHLAFVENGDSFSWNVIDRLPFERHAIDLCSGDDTVRTNASIDRADCVVIGPGPRDPARAHLVGYVHRAARRGVPTLGVCLGHQAIGVAFGARLGRVTPAHGVRDQVTFAGTRWLEGLAGTHPMMRYHSLALDQVTAPLRVVGTNAEGIVMAIEHETLPMAGFQFHPDSFGTPGGEAMLAALFVHLR